MSTLSRYIIFNYTRSLLLFISLCFTLLICSKLEPIANLIAAGVPVKLVGRFFMTFFPLFLSLSVPLASLISTFFTLYSMSTSGELLALRASGISIWRLALPFFLIGLFISFSLTYSLSEWDTTAHTRAKYISKDILTANPLALIQQTSHLPIGMIVHRALQTKDIDELLIGVYPPQNQKMMLYITDPLKLENEVLYGTHSTLITTLKKGEEPPCLLMDHTENSEMNLDQLLGKTKKSSLRIKSDYLPLSHLRQFHTKKRQELSTSMDPMQTEAIKQTLNINISECIRRLSLGLLGFSLTFLGFTKGCYLSRKLPIIQFSSLVFFTTLTLITYFIAHNLERHIMVAGFLYLTPQLAMILHCTQKLYQFERGR